MTAKHYVYDFFDRSAPMLEINTESLQKLARERALEAQTRAYAIEKSLGPVRAETGSASIEEWIRSLPERLEAPITDEVAEILASIVRYDDALEAVKVFTTLAEAPVAPDALLVISQKAMAQLTEPWKPSDPAEEKYDARMKVVRRAIAPTKHAVLGLSTLLAARSS